MGKSYGNIELSDIEIEGVRDFYDWLRGEHHPDCMTKKFKSPKLTARMAFRVIYYLQEVMEILPDKFERCKTCNELFNDQNEGDSAGHCDNCRKD